LATGSSDALVVRVGDGAAETGMLDGFDNNTLCYEMTEKLVLTTPKFIRCRRALIGRYVSIKVVDYIEQIQLKLCEVDITTAWSDVVSDAAAAADDDDNDVIVAMQYGRTVQIHQALDYENFHMYLQVSMHARIQV